MSNTLYDRLGGHDAVEAVVDEFYDRVLADESLEPYFEDVPMDQLRAHQVAFLSAVAGGPDEYDGADMRTAHERFELTDAEFDAVAAHLEAALRENDAPDAVIETVLADVETLRDPVLDR